MCSARFITDAFLNHIRYGRYMNCVIACVRLANENAGNVIFVVQFLIKDGYSQLGASHIKPALVE